MKVSAFIDCDQFAGEDLFSLRYEIPKRRELESKTGVSTAASGTMKPGIAAQDALRLAAVIPSFQS